jgi:NADH pyrophosphatase NudC (nudix superfamily)/nicotinamide mononucleotide (NMN) deamidase PncC
MMAVSSSFRQLVSVLKRNKKTVAVVESSCGGLINAGILAQPGASAVYYGGTVAYNTRRAKPLLLNLPSLHESLLNQRSAISSADEYVASKLHWTKETSLAYCKALQVDYVIAEGGATGPTFHYHDLSTGFAVVCVAAATNGDYKVVRQRVVHSTHANRYGNMKLFTESAAEVALQAILEREEGAERDASDDYPSKPPEPEFTESKRSSKGGPRWVLDRATHLRSQARHIEELARRSTTRYVALREKSCLFLKQDTESAMSTPDTTQKDDARTRKLAYLSKEQVDALVKNQAWTALCSFLGFVGEESAAGVHPEGALPIFGVNLLGGDKSDHETSKTYLSSVLSTGVTWEDTRSTAPSLSAIEYEQVLYATALAEWQKRSAHCPQCGGDAPLDVSGHSRRCRSCAAQSWPRQDPSIIVAVSSRDGQRILLARSKRHPDRYYTVLAGFVEAGETMEGAVAREVLEETSIRLDHDSVRYVASQPWPFPQSTMIGFVATADDRKQHIKLDPNELVEAGWFTREQVRAASLVSGSSAAMQPEAARKILEQNPHAELLIPSGVVARRLIDHWLEQ